MNQKIYTLTDEGSGESKSPQLSTEERVKVILNEALGLVLRHLGVDMSGNVENQIEQMEIIIEHCQEESNPQIRGTYVLRRQEKNIFPVAFIGNTRVEGQKIEMDVVMFRGDELKV